MHVTVVPLLLSVKYFHARALVSGDLGYDGLGLGAGGHAGHKKISKIKQSFQTCQGSVQQSTEVIYI